jgi:hypothetical protein
LKNTRQFIPLPGVFLRVSTSDACQKKRMQGGSLFPLRHTLFLTYSATARHEHAALQHANASPVETRHLVLFAICFSSIYNSCDYNKALNLFEDTELKYTKQADDF